MPVDNTQLNTALQGIMQSYTGASSSGGVGGATSLFSSILQEKLSEQAYESVADSVDVTQRSGAKSTVESTLPMLLMNSIMSGSSSEASSSLMMALMLALSSETGQEQLAGLGSALSATQSSGVNAYSTVGAAYNNAKNSSVAGTGSAASAGTRAGTANKAEFANSARIISNAGNRSADVYRAVIDQFNVEDNPKYQPRNGGTFCNLYQQDVTEAMGAAIPHCVNTKTGEPTTKDDPDMMYMNANRTSDWLNEYGAKYGWYEVGAEQAQQLANQGHPAVTIWKNLSGGHGHCQIVSPSESGGFDPQRGVAISQAGRRLMNYSYITNVYSASLPEVQYFAHV